KTSTPTSTVATIFCMIPPYWLSRPGARIADPSSRPVWTQGVGGRVHRPARVTHMSIERDTHAGGEVGIFSIGTGTAGRPEDDPGIQRHQGIHEDQVGPVVEVDG